MEALENRKQLSQPERIVGRVKAGIISVRNGGKGSGKKNSFDVSQGSRAMRYHKRLWIAQKSTSRKVKKAIKWLNPSIVLRVNHH